MPKKIDYLRIYPGLNDFTDALEALPLEMVRHLTLLKEIDAKCATTTPQLSRDIATFMDGDSSGQERQEKLMKIITLLKEVMPCIEEKMHVANMAAESMSRHIQRIETDYQLITDNEIPLQIQVDENDPAISEVRVDKPQGARTEPIRGGATTRKTVAQAALERARTPVTRSRGRRPTPQVNTPDHSPLAPTDKRRRGAGGALARNAQVYCYCDQPAYGEMVCCDNPDCEREWFHLACIGREVAPKGPWTCDECGSRKRRA